jgi:hypothetical protein
MSSGHNTAPEDSVRRAEAAYSLPRTVLNVTAGKDKLVVTKGTEPDPQARFMLHFQGSPFSNDNLVAEVSEDSLLKSIHATSDDQTGAIAVNLAEAVFSFGTGGAALPAGRKLPETLPGAEGFAASYDPLDPSDVAATRGPLAKAGFCILVGNETLNAPRACSETPHTNDASAPYVVDMNSPAVRDPVQYLSRRSGVFYRQPTPMPVHIYRKVGQDWDALFVGNENLFDKSEVYEVAINRATFVKKEVKLTFQGGALTNVTIDKPSQFYQLSTFGLQIVKIIVAIPLEALKQDKALIDAEAERIKAETTLLQAQNDLLKLQVERQGSTQDNVVSSNVDFVDAGARSLGAADVGNELSICQTNLGASVAQCRTLIERGSDGF